MRRSTTPYILLLTALLAGLVFLAGCEEEVVAVTGIDRPFTLYGVLTPQADTQRIAVFSIEGRLQPVEPIPLDGQLSSTDLSSNLAQSWTQEIVQDTLGQYAHVYSSTFTAAYATPYRIEIVRSDGALSSVDVTVPPLTELELPPQLLTMPTIFPIRINGQAPNLIQIEIRYRVLYDVGGFIGEESYTVFYDEEAERTISGWIINVNVQRDMQTLKAILTDNGTITPNTLIKPIELRVNLIVANEEWDAPGGVFDPDVLAQPGLLSNVDNGFGFVGAGYRLAGRWAPVDSFIVAGQGEVLPD